MTRLASILIVSALLPLAAAAQESLDIGEIYLGSAPCRILSGSGSPEGSVTAEPCSVYLRTSDGSVWRKASGSSNTGWQVISLPDGDANEVLVHDGNDPSFSGTPTVTSLTASSVLTSPRLTASGGLELDPSGDITLDPGGNDVLPGSAYTDNFGGFSSKWLTIHAAELWVSTLVAQDVMSTIGGRVVIAPTTELAADLASGGTSISVKHNNLASGDRVFLEGNGMFEAMAITSGPSGSGPYTYSVTRNLDGSGANDWPAGSAVLNTGTTGDGFIDLYSDNGLVTGSTFGPTIVGNVRTGTTYNAVAPRWAIGNLNGLYGYATDTYGAAFGDPSKAWLKIDATNGVRIGHGSTTLTEIDASGNASFTGTITSSAGEIGAWDIGSTALTSTNISLVADVLANEAVLFGTSSSVLYRTGATTAVDNFTFGGWFYIENPIDQTRYALYNGAPNGGGGFGLTVQTAGGGVWRGHADGVFTALGDENCPVVLGTWMHIVFRRQSGTSSLWCNGVLVSTRAATPNVATSPYWSVGAARNAADTGWTDGIGGIGGRAAHVFRVTYAMTDEEIQEMYDAGPDNAGLAPTLVTRSTVFSYYPLQGTSLAPYQSNTAVSLTADGTVTYGVSGPTVYIDRPRVEVGAGTNRAGIASTSSGTDIAIWAGARYNNRGNARFRVHADGTLVATNATIAGTVTATSGTIAGLTLASGSMTATNLGIYSGAANSARVEIGTGAAAGGLNSCNSSSDIGLWIGQTHGNRASAPFRVTCAGALVATNGTFSGDGSGLTSLNGGNIMAGSITATQIAANSITADRLNVSTLSAITANLGTVTAGFLSGVTAEFGGAVTLNSSGITIENGNSTVNQIKWDDGSLLQGFGGNVSMYGPSNLFLLGSTGVIGFSAADGFSPHTPLTLGNPIQRWNIGYFNAAILYDQLPLTFNHAAFKSGNQYLCVDSAGRVFASPTGC